jgi:hypothetical protein
MFKFSYKIVEGAYDDVKEEHLFHVIILRHTLRTDLPREDGRGFQITDEQIVETFTRYSEDMAREDAFRRTGELTVAA